MKKIITLFLLFNLIAVPFLVFAAGSTGSIVPPADNSLAGDIGKVAQMSTQPIDQTLNTVANYVIGALVVMAVFYVIWAGFTFISSAGDPTKVDLARKRIMYAAIGIVVALLAKGIVSLVLSAMKGNG